MASLIVADAAARDDVEIVAGIGPKGRDYIGKDIGEVAMIGKTVGAPVVDDLESVIDGADVVCDFSRVELGMEVLDACIRHKKALVIGTTGFNAEQRARLEAAASEIPILIAANTDRMVNVMRKLLMEARRSERHRPRADREHGRSGRRRLSRRCRIRQAARQTSPRERQSHLPCHTRRRHPVQPYRLLLW